MDGWMGCRQAWSGSWLTMSTMPCPALPVWMMMMSGAARPPGSLPERGCGLGAVQGPLRGAARTRTTAGRRAGVGGWAVNQP